MSRRTILAALLALAAVAVALAADPADDVPSSTAVSRIESAAADAARARIAPPDRLEVVSSRYAGGDPLPEGEIAAEAFDVEGPSEVGLFRVRLRLLSGGVAKGEARATVKGAVLGPALVSKGVLAKGEAVPEDSVLVREENLTGSDEPPLRDPAELAGLVPSRVLSAGRVLTPSLFQGATVVRRGQSVDLRVVEGPLVVSGRGTAKRDGAAGDTVVAETSSRVLVLGVVEPDGSLRVVGRAGRRGTSR